MARKKIEQIIQREIRVFIYARRSSDRQNEESCPQQIAECKRMAERLGYTVVKVYADEAKTGKTDKRPEFQKMVRAIEAGKCDVVIAYKSNRIARNMLQALTYENRFEQHGVKMLYAKEEFGDNAAGRFALRNMMNLNQFYSENMSEDIKRCLYTYAEECKVLNGRLPLGLKKGGDGRYAIDEDTVGIVREIFDLYASGVKSSAICASLNARGIKTSRGSKFSIGTIEHIIKNKKYIGLYTYANISVPDGVPRIIDDNTFAKAQQRLAEAHRAPARAWSQTEYLLTGKLFCGHCGSTMTGEAATGRHGGVYNYYCCHSRKRKGTSYCSKARVRKDVLEDMIVEFTAKNALTDDIIEQVADAAVRLQNENRLTVEHQQHIAHLAEVRQKIQNIVNAIAAGVFSPALQKSLEALEEEEEQLAKQVAAESCERPTFTKEQMIAWMKRFQHGDTKSPKFRKQIIDIFVHSIYLYDDHFTICYHTGEKHDLTQTITASEMEDSFDDGSPSSQFAPPNDDNTNPYEVRIISGFFIMRSALLSS